MEELEIVKTFENKLEAEIAKAYLDSYGIVSFIRADDEGGMLGRFQLGARGVLLFVKKSEKEKAFQLLKSKDIA